MMETNTIRVDNYQALELIHESERTLVYRGINLESEQSVVVKLMGNKYPSFNELVQFRNQYAIAKNLDIKGIVKPYSLLRYQNGYALIMEDIRAISLAEYQRQFSVSVKQFWEIALQIVDTLHHLHQNHIIHKDIKPANILIHPETKEVKLIDFSISSLLPKERTSLQTPNVLEGTLAYLSPEQTGRMNRGIDYRSDFYSLGVTFYELLTGKLPFESEDALELVHAHIAKIPPTISETQVPKPLVNIVMKLMAKNAEQRYQSALGLKYDLEKCRVQYQQTGKIEPFVLGERDLCEHFLIPEKLYGREIEVQTLLDAFERVASPLGKGKAEMMLVAGYSGVGKTAVVNEVHKPITRQKGYFIKGKFDQFNRNIPFSAFVQAFRSLMGQLLGESDAQLQKWKEKILEAVGESGQVLIDVIPELERIIEKQPTVPRLEGSAAQNRFNLLFEKFIAVFTTIEHPLTIFLDDLQWVDSASLNLLKVLMGDNHTGYLLLLGAYRDNEVFPAHPLMLTLGELEKQQTTISTITLAPLSVTHINQLVAETLGCRLDLAAPLTDLVYQKTKGNPFFTTQFLKGLHEDGWIEFNPNLRYWQCDLVRVREATLTDDVVEFIARRLYKLPEETQKVLKLAACIGNQFELETLAIICESLSEEVAAALWTALREGLILPQSQAYKFFQGWEQDKEQADGVAVGYRFLHDRVQQAAYSLTPEAQKQQTHLKIGRLLLKNTSGENLEEKIFDIVNHLNMGMGLVVGDEEKKQLCKLNLQAGCKAKNTTAYEAAIEYFLLGIELLTENSWEREYELTLALYEFATESAYLNSDFKKMEQLAEVGLENARNLLDTIKLYEVKIQALEAQTRFQEALDTAMIILEKLGISQFPKEPDSSDIELWLERVRENLGDRHPTTLVELPVMTDPNILAAMNLMFYLTPTAYKYKPMLMVLITFEEVILSLQYGNSLVSTYAYSVQGLVLCNTFGEIEKGYQFGQLALELQPESNAVAYGRAFYVMNALIKHYKEHLRNSLKGLKEAYVACLEVGDLEFAGYAIAFYSFYSYLSGTELSGLAEEMSANSKALERIKKTTPKNWIDIYRQIVDNLLGRSQNPCVIVGKAYNEEKMLPLRKQANDLTTQSYLYVPRVFLCYLFQDWDGAFDSLENAEKCLGGAAGTALVTLFYFYQSLLMLAEFTSQPESECRERLEKIAANQKLLENAAIHAPTNYLHKWHLIAAEKHRVLGEKMEAIEMYDRAIAGAKENSYIQEEALANELAAKFYLEWGKAKIATTYMQDAYYCYAYWGAKAKVDNLQKCYPQLLSPILQRQQLGLTANSKITTLTKGTVSSTSKGTGELLDLASLMKASRSLSEEIDLDCAIANFMEVIQENAGAETVALMLFQEDLLMLTAYATQEEMSVISIPVETSNNVPLTFVNQVKNTREHLVLDNAKEDNNYSRDDYIQKHQPQSVLCIPLIDRGQLIGILYLENNQVSGAFTSDRVEILNLLCSQAAITLQNAKLYDKEQQARNKLQQALTDLQQAQLQLVQSEKMATLGNLVAGVAHEINNPVGFIGGNVEMLKENLGDLSAIIEGYREELPEPSPKLTEEIEELDLDFLLEDIPKTIASMAEGCERIRHISTSLRTFSRTDTENKTEFNLHDGIDSTLLILKYRLKANEQRPAIEIVKKYGEIPAVKCYPGQLNQVFMNLLANAIDALDESNQGKTFSEIEKEPNQINISTELSADKKSVMVEIADNGMGIPEEIKARIFEQGFTTKGVGKGTGLGMAIAHQIVTEKHGGKISCDSTVGQGTIFMIVIPR
ncbi:MAG: AAA family ATPase [Okeania sp. SIO3B5]|uniref:trifunctional serine/threonine-protein kinase/ATP-binding protein/sensor histidine kinase n=1 Tax=Okeania sp. SIO3B5 TaxID=2607811 RepID=UPI001400908C|nr:ATP-binding sensor histidine kinase [Okeania sp. SIO3B5]NEO52298.1 AAA family ATPase [Okeania sp. SIO3B5]